MYDGPRFDHIILRCVHVFGLWEGTAFVEVNLLTYISPITIFGLYALISLDPIIDYINGHALQLFKKHLLSFS
jgi:hypothetical protein